MIPTKRIEDFTPGETCRPWATLPPVTVTGVVVWPEPCPGDGVMLVTLRTETVEVTRRAGTWIDLT